MKPIRVTHVVSGDLWAGAEVATFHLIRALAARDDVAVEAVVLNRGELASRLSKCGVAVRVEPEAERSLRALVRAVRGHVASADLVHAHRYKEDLLAVLAGRPWVATQHGRPEPFAGRAAVRMHLYEALDIAARRVSARAVIAVSSEVEAWLRPRVGARRVRLAWNGIADPTHEVGLAPWAERPPCVGVLARLTPVKAVDLAIDAVAACPGVGLEIVGDGRERAALEQRAARSGAAQRIRFVGFDPAPLARLARWRALLVTSLHEGNPIAVLEALGLGTPIVHPGLGGVREISGPPAAVDAGGREAGCLASAIQGLTRDDALGAIASAAARARFLEAFTAEAAAARVVAVYRASLS